MKDERSMSEVWAALSVFADRVGVTLTGRGECGFGRPCVGLLKGDHYVDYNPVRFEQDVMQRKAVYPTTYDQRVRPPDSVPGAYHKHNCFAVLAYPETEDGEPDYDTALRQLLRWVEYLEQWGPVQLTAYDTGYRGIHALVHGVTGWALVIGDGQPVGQGRRLVIPVGEATDADQ